MYDTRKLYRYRSYNYELRLRLPTIVVANYIENDVTKDTQPLNYEIFLSCSTFQCFYNQSYDHKINLTVARNNTQKDGVYFKSLKI